MMSFRLALLPIIDAARELSHSVVDIRTHQLTIRTRTWAGPMIGDGTSIDVDFVLPARYPVRMVSGQEVAGSGGRYTLDDVLVNHITPSDGNGVGFTATDLEPLVTAPNVETIYVLAGPDGGEFSLKDGRFLRPFTYALVLTRRL